MPTLVFSEKSWRINAPAVSSELVEGEVVAIHLPSGMYYSLRGVAAVCWEGIAAGLTGQQLGEFLAGWYEVEVVRATLDLSRFMDELLQEGLIEEAKPNAADGFTSSVAKGSYAVPQLEKFSDLQDLLLLDPIHEVSQQGWPHRAE